MVVIGEKRSDAVTDVGAGVGYADSVLKRLEILSDSWKEM